MSELFSDQMRRAIEGSGRTRYWIYRQTGIDQSTLSRFMKGDGSLSMRAIELIMNALDLEIQPATRKRT